MGGFAQYAINLYSWMEVFSAARRVLTERISKNGNMLSRNQSPFSPLIPLKAFLEIDCTESRPPLWITVAQFQSHFFTVQRYGHLFYYTTRCKAWRLQRRRPHSSKNNRDSITSLGVLAIASRAQISAIALVIPFSRSAFLHHDHNVCSIQHVFSDCVFACIAPYMCKKLCIDVFGRRRSYLCNGMFISK